MYPDAELAPQDVVESLIRYRDHGIPTGDFLQAVLADTLSEAVGRADSDNLPLLPHIVVWIFQNMPNTSWGNREKIAAWIKTKKEEEEQS